MQPNFILLFYGTSMACTLSKRCISSQEREAQLAVKVLPVCLNKCYSLFDSVLSNNE